MSRSTLLLGTFWIILAVALFASQYLIPGRIEIKWETESEFDTAGFNVLRRDSDAGQFIRINESIIAGAADPALGGSYQYVDSNVERGKIYYYRLEDIEYDNTTRFHEIIEAKVENQAWWVTILILGSALAGIGIFVDAALRIRVETQ